MRAGIYVDSDNVMRNGGWGIRYHELYKIVADQGADIIRANAYMAADLDRENKDPTYRQTKEAYRSQVRRCGFKVHVKPVRRYTNDAGETTSRANVDVDLAVDAMAQSCNLDYVVIVSGDGDFTRLVTALQDKGIRVDVISFFNTSGALKTVADNHSYGQMIPGLVPLDPNRRRGTFVSVDQDRFFGHIAFMDDYLVYGEHVFCHGSEINPKVSNDDLLRLYEKQAIMEFDLVRVPGDRGTTKLQAQAVTVITAEP